jgi:uncharacterized protein YcbK (DUF882 family)
MMSWTSKYFSYDEMKCKCGCNQAPMDQQLMTTLDSIREAMGKPLIISSGYRCPNHPIEAKKSKPGAHATGKAADLAVEREDAYKVLMAALFMDIKRIGVQQKGSGRFIHLDTAGAEDGFPTPTVWSY